MPPPDPPPAAPSVPGLRVRRATAADHADVLRLLADLDLDYPGRDLPSFFVGEVGGRVVAIAEVRDLGAVRLLSCVGVRGDLQGRGLGRDLVEAALADVREEVALYTQSAGFFARLGFLPVAALPPGVPPRQLYGCATCSPETCVAMLRPARTSAAGDALDALRRVGPDDAPRLASHLGALRAPTCDLTVPGVLLWRDCDRPAAAVAHGHLVLAFTPHHERPYALEPLPGPGADADGDSAAARIAAFEAALARVRRGSRIREEFARTLPADRFRVEPVRDHFDYVYDVRRFAAPAGRGLDGLRNRLRKFAREHPRHELRPLSAADGGAALALFDRWAGGRNGEPAGGPAPRAAPSLLCQRRAIERAFGEFDALRLHGVALVVDAALRGFLVASRAHDTAFVHFLHADEGVVGAPQTLLHAACRDASGGAAWIDLEEDLGIDGLRRTKLSYRPDRLVPKYDVTAA